MQYAEINNILTFSIIKESQSGWTQNTLTDRDKIKTMELQTGSANYFNTPTSNDNERVIILVHRTEPEKNVKQGKLIKTTVN
jgi:hypothetical protein